MSPPTRQGPFLTTMTIGGAATEGRGEVVEVYDPATEEVLAEVPSAAPEQVDAAIAAARRAFPSWSGQPPEARAAHLRSWVEALEAHREELLMSIVAEVGTPVSVARGMQVELGLAHLRWMAEAALTDWTEDLGVHDGPSRNAAIVAQRPAGVVAAITAYNYPLNLAVFKVGAALAAGCTSVLLPSIRTPITALRLVELAHEAGLPDGVLNVVVGGAEAGRALCEDERVAKVSFTGSVDVGRIIMRQAASTLKGVVLELGGKSPNLLMPGAATDPAIVEEVHLRYARNGGQGCTVPSRVIIARSDLDRFLDLSAEVYERIVVGDPFDAATHVGPLIRPEHRRNVEGFVAEAVDEGATVLLGGGRPSHLAKGWFTNPTLVGGVPSSARIAQEEIFGPVAVLLTYDRVEEGIELANDVSYGLGAYVWAPDVDEGRAVAARIRAGFVWINGGGGFRPDAPFGGFNLSGIGREWGEWGIKEFLEPQTIQWPVV